MGRTVAATLASRRDLDAVADSFNNIIIPDPSSVVREVLRRLEGMVCVSNVS